MFDVQRQCKCKDQPVIRVVSSLELDAYEEELLKKLETVEFNAQENRLEDIDLFINEQECPIDIVDKTAIINVKTGKLASKNSISQEDIEEQEVFKIDCSLD